jgi:hypothetical protein
MSRTLADIRTSGLAPQVAIQTVKAANGLFRENALGLSLLVPIFTPPPLRPVPG